MSDREPLPNASPLLERLVRRATVALALERLWRISAALFTLFSVFAALSLAGVWLETERWTRILGVAVFAGAVLFVLARGLSRLTPKRRDALSRLDASPGGEHRAASSLEDTLAGGADDGTTLSLWSLHRRALEKKLAGMEVAPAAPQLAERDPFALRALAFVAAVGAAVAAGPERQTRLLAAFDWSASGAKADAQRIDAWLDPPSYTNRPPLVLSGADAAGAAAAFASPVNSVLIVRVFGRRDAGVATSGALAPFEDQEQRGAASERVQKFRLKGDARVIVPSPSGAKTFDIAAIPDRPPTIELLEPPRSNARGSMTIRYRVDDDYGVARAEAAFSLAARPGKLPGRSLFPPPQLPLSLPPSGLGETRTTLDLADHPWAGARAVMTLIAHDDAGNEGRSAPLEAVLPQRHFAHPVARALVEQRRNLALDPDHPQTTAAALEGLALGAKLFQTPSALYLGLSVAKTRLAAARSDDDLREVAQMLWSMALSLEEGEVSQAERDLRAAEKALREALARSASEEEIQKLTSELRAALDEFLRGLAERAGRNSAPPGSEKDPRALSEQDLRSILNDLESAGRSGDLSEAQRLLGELEDVLENLEPARTGAQNPMAREMMRALDELGRLAREQQQLRDEVFQGAQAGAGAEEAKDQRRRQQALRERLQQQQSKLRQAGEDQPELNEAGRAMKEAFDALGAGGVGRGKAMEAQGRALQALRRGADQLAARLQGEGEEEGGGRRSGRGRGFARDGDDDPLGRPPGRRRAYDSRARYDPLGLPPALRARRLQEELRRRLGEPERSKEELDYLERLLRR